LILKREIFDADFAEAITQIPAPSDEFKGKIVDVLEKDTN
jgi:molecular chaperone GrpE